MATPLEDYQLDFSGGQDASQIPARVDISKVFSAVNTSFEKGICRPRFGYQYKSLTFSIPEQFVLTNGRKISYEDIFHNGVFQAAIPYAIGTTYFQVLVISGVIFLVNQSTWEVTLIEIADGSRINEVQPRVYWTYAGRFIEIFDYPAYPVILDGYTARRADPKKMETPVSVLGCYNNTYVFFANAGDDFTASDPAAYGFPDGPISCTEILTPASDYYGQIFQLPAEFTSESITAMCTLQATDSSTGIGQLLVSTKNQVFSFQTQLTRDQWSSGSIQFGSSFIYGSGIVGQRAFANVGSDLYYVDATGQIRSAAMSRSEQTTFSKIPLSKEVDNFLKIPTNPGLLQYSTITYFKNKVIVSVNPYYIPATSTEGEVRLDIAFGGYVVLELDSISNLEVGGNPDWAGLWTGIRPMDTFINNERCFCIAKENGKNAIFEIDPNLTYDVVGDEQAIRKIRSKVYTREYNFQQPYVNKTLNNFDITLYNLKGDFQLDLKYKPSHGSNFIRWTDFTHVAPWRTCNLDSKGTLIPLNGHQFKDCYLGSPEEEGVDPVMKQTLDTFRKVQLLLQIEGIYWEVHDFRILANAIPENNTQPISNDLPVVKIYGECDTDWEIPDICQEIQTT